MVRTTSLMTSRVSTFHSETSSNTQKPSIIIMLTGRVIVSIAPCHSHFCLQLAINVLFKVIATWSWSATSVIIVITSAFHEVVFFDEWRWWRSFFDHRHASHVPCLLSFSIGIHTILSYLSRSTRCVSGQASWSFSRSQNHRFRPMFIQWFEPSQAWTPAWCGLRIRVIIYYACSCVHSCRAGSDKLNKYARCRSTTGKSGSLSL